MHAFKHLFLLIFFISSTHLFARTITTYTAVATGNWNNSSTWSPAGIPGDGDFVIIDGFVVTHSSGTVNVDQINLTNNSNVGESTLRIESSAKLIVKDSIVVEAENYNHDVRIRVFDFGELSVGANIRFERKIDNVQNTRCALHILNNGKVNITGNYIYQHKNGDEAFSELWLEGDAILDIDGNLVFERSGSVGTGGSSPLALDTRDNAQIMVAGNLEANLTGGDMIDFMIIGQSSLSVTGNMTLNNSNGTNKINITIGNDLLDTSTFSVGGDLNLNSTSSNKLIDITGNHGSTLNVTGDISLAPIGESTVKLALISTSTLNLGGAILRPNDFGSLTMDATSTLNLNGSQPQSLAPNKLENSGADSLYYSTVTFNNTSGSPTTLSGPLLIENHLAMDDGIIVSSSSNPLILADNATIGAGNSDAFIDGPIIKRGRTGSGGMTFPTGKGSTYRPMAISEVTNINSEFQVEYYGDPPPLGTVDKFEAGIDNIFQYGYWAIGKNSSTGDLNYTLHWTDAAATGINDLASLIVVGSDGANWFDYGQQSTTGGTGAGVGGTITSLSSDPPPLGTEYLTYGSTSALNSLPVELSKFTANVADRITELRWQTESELAFSHFEIERSIDGRSFEKISTVSGEGSINSGSNYIYYDQLPYSDLNYYRLKIVDLDGSFEYSNIEVVNFSKTKEIGIYPNPVIDLIQITGPQNQDGKMLFQVFDRTGKQIYENWIDFENGAFQISSSEININSPGMYIVRLSNAIKSQEIRIVKIK